jgi:hypothetical protein
LLIVEILQPKLLICRYGTTAEIRYPRMTDTSRTTVNQKRQHRAPCCRSGLHQWEIQAFAAEIASRPSAPR